MGKAKGTDPGHGKRGEAMEPSGRRVVLLPLSSVAQAVPGHLAGAQWRLLN